MLGQIFIDNFFAFKYKRKTYVLKIVFTGLDFILSEYSVALLQWGHNLTHRNAPMLIAGCTFHVVSYEKRFSATEIRGGIHPYAPRLIFLPQLRLRIKLSPLEVSPFWTS